MNESVEHVGTALDGHYDLIRELGRGGMATVYLAEHPKHGCTRSDLGAPPRTHHHTRPRRRRRLERRRRGEALGGIAVNAKE